VIAVFALVLAAAGAVIGLLVQRLRAERAALAALRDAIAVDAEQLTVIRRGHGRLSDALDALDDGVVVFDDRGRVAVRNRVAVRFESGRRSDALVGDAIEQLASAALAGSAGTRELALFGPPRQSVLLRAEPLGDVDRPVGAVVWVRDVTESRRIDDMRRDFVANVSHELRTPVGALGLLAETMADETDPVVMRQFAERIDREAERLGRIVDDLLDLSVIETDGSAAREPVGIAGVLRDAVDQVRGAADLAGHPIHLAECPPDLLVRGDRRQLVSAVYNLLDNAVKYSEAASPIELGVHKEADCVEIAVRDHGIGIPTRDIERIFERFYRVDRARSRDTGGTGLGLSIVRHVAVAHGGTVGVTSHEGEGSTFTLTIPLLDTSADGRPDEGPHNG
jgi:two-component system sensor histidine kinase SenX3